MVTVLDTHVAIALCEHRTRQLLGFDWHGSSLYKVSDGGRDGVRLSVEDLVGVRYASREILVRCSSVPSVAVQLLLVVGDHHAVRNVRIRDHDLIDEIQGP